jgi:hypothetical protein
LLIYVVHIMSTSPLHLCSGGSLGLRLPRVYIKQSSLDFIILESCTWPVTVPTTLYLGQCSQCHSLRFDLRGQSETHRYSRAFPTHDVWSRLSSLELQTTHNHSAQAILRIARPILDFSVLERVVIRTDFPLNTGAMSPEVFPNLRKLIISYNHPPVQRSNVIPFTTLTHLCISGMWLSAQYGPRLSGNVPPFSMGPS